MLKSIFIKDIINKSRNVASCFKVNIRYLVIAFVFMLLTLCLTFPVPWVSMRLVDSALKMNDSKMFFFLIIIWIVSILLKLLSEYIQSYHLYKYQLYSGQALRTQVFEHLFRLPIGYYSDKTSGYLVTRIFSDVEEFVNVFGGGILELTRNGISIIAGIVMLLMINWKLSLFTFVLTPFFFINQIFFSKKIRTLSLQKKEAWAKIGGFIQEVISGIFSVKAYNQESFEIKRFNDKCTPALNLNIANWRLLRLSGSVLGIIQSLSPVLIFSIAGYYIMNGKMTTGELVGFTGYLGLLFSPASGIFNYLISLQSSIVSLERINEILNQRTENDIQDQRNILTENNIIGKIQFRNVSFSYKQSENEFKIENFNLEINPGEIVGLIGKSGSGKTSLINLLLGFYKPISGQILINNISTENYEVNQIREIICVVPQDVYIFSGTIWENISYGRPFASSEEIKKAAKLAYADNFISKLEEGYETILGEKGFQLSGGQKQMISLARAFLRNPQILILDEATSAVDSHSESQIKEALKNLMSSRTTILISHRLSTLINVERVILINNGQCIIQGAPNDLLHNNNHFRDLFHEQINLGIMPIEKSV